MKAPSPSKTEESDDLEFGVRSAFDDVSANVEQPRVDPATIAARLMLLHSVRENRLREQLTAPVIAVVVAVPDPAWLEPIAAQWREQLLNGEEPADGDVDARLFRNGLWVEFQRDGSNASHGPTRGNETVAEALWNGSSVIDFATTPSTQLPRDLMRVADFHFLIPPMNAEILSGVIAEIVGQAPTVAIAEDVPPKVTPALLKLAWRSGQSADAYLGRLVALIAQGSETGRSGPSLEDLHGMDAATDWGKAMVRDMRDYRAGRIAWRDMSRGLLLHGAPGTGKTLFAGALGRSTGLPLIAASFAEWQASGTGHLGDCLKAMRATFDAARRAAPCILFIDEIDALGDRKRCDRGYRDYWTSVVTCFLEQLDGTGGREGVIAVGATNNPEVLDEAIKRSGRMDRLIEIQLPDHAALNKILRHHLGADLDGIDLSDAARRAFGGTGADCARWVRSARQRARHLSRSMVLNDLVVEIGGPELDPAEETRVATHEAGHAVIASLLRPDELVDVRIGDAVGNSGLMRTMSRVKTTRKAVHHRLLELLAGRAAEQILLCDVSGGCGGSAASDLAQATCLSVALEATLGLGSTGLLWLGEPAPESVGTMLAYRPALAARVQAYLDTVYLEVVGLIQRHRNAVSAVAGSLAINRSLTGAEIADLVEQNPPTDEYVGDIR
jgi:cell division protease FtsH